MRRSFLCVALVVSAAVVGTILGAERKLAALREQGLLLANPAESSGPLVMGGVDLKTALEGLQEVSPRRELTTGMANSGMASEDRTGAIAQGLGALTERVPQGQLRVFRVMPGVVPNGGEADVTPLAPGTRTMYRVLVRIASPAEVPVPGAATRED